MKNKIVVEPNRFDVDIKNGLNKAIDELYLVESPDGEE